MSQIAPTRFSLSVRLAAKQLHIDADEAIAVVPTPETVRVPGAPAAVDGIAWYEGEPLPIIRVGDERGPVVVCDTKDHGRVGLAGLAVDGTARVRTGDPNVVWLDPSDVVERALATEPTRPWRA